MPKVGIHVRIKSQECGVRMEVRLEQLASNVHHHLGLALKKEQTVACHQFYLKGKTWEGPPEEGTATHSSILAWRIPWTEEPGGLQSMGLHRVRHDWSNLARVRQTTETNSAAPWPTKRAHSLNKGPGLRGKLKAGSGIIPDIYRGGSGDTWLTSGRQQ